MLQGSLFFRELQKCPVCTTGPRWRTSDWVTSFVFFHLLICNIYKSSYLCMRRVKRKKIRPWERELERKRNFTNVGCWSKLTSKSIKKTTWEELGKNASGFLIFASNTVLNERTPIKPSVRVHVHEPTCIHKHIQTFIYILKGFKSGDTWQREINFCACVLIHRFWKKQCFHVT